MIALIDGDVLCYQATYHIWQDRLKDAGLIADASNIRKVFYSEDGEKVIPPMTKEQERKYLEKAWHIFKNSIKKLADKYWCTEILMAVKGPDNFRDTLYPDYKKNRHVDEEKRNIFVPILRKLAVAEDMAVEAVGREADDLLRIWALQARLAGDPYIVMSIDKDLRCIPGSHLFIDEKREALGVVEISELEARDLYYKQLISGDPTDNIPGVPGLGPKKADKIIANCTTDAECQEAVVSQYIAAYGDEWYSYFLSNAKMIHLQTHPDDYFKASSWPIVMELR